jgi:hypothetical protein
MHGCTGPRVLATYGAARALRLGSTVSVAGNPGHVLRLFHGAKVCLVLMSDRRAGVGAVIRIQWTPPSVVCAHKLALIELAEASAGQTPASMLGSLFVCIRHSVA